MASTIVTSGTVTVPNDQALGTIQVGGTAGIAAIIASGDTAIAYANPDIAPGALIDAVQGVSAPEQSLLDAQGNFVNRGTIAADGAAGSRFTIAIAPSATQAGFFANDGTIATNAGNTMTISVAAGAEFFNPGLVAVNGGSLDLVAAGSNAIAGGLAPENGLFTISNGGTFEDGIATPGSVGGSSFVVAFTDANHDTLKLDQPGAFDGRIVGFQSGDTIDLGTLAVTSLVYSAGGLLTLQNGGSTVASLVLYAGNFQTGTFAVSGGVAGSFRFTTGTNGHTLLTTAGTNTVWTAGSGSWGTTADWSGGATPGSTSTAIIGNGGTGAIGVSTGSAASAGSLVLDDPNATLTVNGRLSIANQPVMAGPGTIEVTSGGSLVATYLRQIANTSVLKLDPGAVVALTGHLNPGFANAGTVTYLAGDTAALTVDGTAVVNAATLDAGPQNGVTTSPDGGFINIGGAGGGNPATMLVAAAGTVRDTFATLDSGPTSFGQLTLSGAGTHWSDAGDPTDTQNTRGYMLVGTNAEAGNTPAAPDAGAAQLVVTNGAALTETSFATIGDTTDSSGTATISAGGVWIIPDWLNVGRYGAGSLLVSNNGTQGAGGTVSLGAGGTITANGTAMSQSAALGIGVFSGASGTVTVDGTGSTLSAQGPMVVGWGGQGAFVVQNGGAATVSTSAGAPSVIGDLAGASGTVTVSGTGSALQTGGELDVGFVGQGTLFVTGGSVHVAGHALIAGGNTSAAAGGTGLIAVTSGGTIRADAGLVIYQGSTVSVDPTSGIDLGTSGSIVAGAINVEAGQSLVGDGVVNASVLNNGTIFAEQQSQQFATLGAPGTLEITGSVGGTGLLALGANAVLRLDGSLAATQTIDFGASPSELILGSPAATIADPILHLGNGDRIELGNGAVITGGTFSSGTLTINTASGTPVLLTNVSTAAGATGQFVTGIDASSGDSFLQMLPPSVTWTGTGSSSFSTGANWLSGAAPNATQAAYFVGNTGATITGSGSAGQLDFSGSGNWVLSGASLTAAGLASPPYQPFALYENGSLTVLGGSLNLGGSSDIDAAGNTAVMSVQNGATISSVGAAFGNYAGGSGALLLSGAGTRWNDVAGSNPGLPGGYMLVGWAGNAPGGANGGAGSLAVTQGAQLADAGGDTIGGDPGSRGTVSVSAGGLLTDAGLTVGDAGSGTLTIAGGTVTTNGLSAIGNSASGIGSVAISSGGTIAGLWTSTGFATIGNAGAGTLSITGGGSLATQAGAAIGEMPGGTGTVSVANGGLWTTTGGNLDIGAAGSGRLSISAAGTVTNSGTATVIGDVAGSSGTVLVSGTGAALGGPASLVIGNAGTGGVSVGGSGIINAGSSIVVGALSGGAGTLSVGAGGSVGSAVLLAGSVAGSDGAVSLSGGILSASNEAVLGDGGEATLSVTSGTLTVGNGGLGIGEASFRPGGAGSATVTGGLLLSQGNISIGANGDQGGLSLASGGTVEAQNEFVIGSGATLGGVFVAGNGTVLVGPGGVLRADGTNIGASGNAALQVGAAAGSVSSLTVSGTGAQATSSAGVAIGGTQGASGAITVSGAGAALNDTGLFAVGSGGTGALLIDAGGLVSDGLANGASGPAASIADAAGSDGSSVTVTGPNSSWQVGGQLVVGGVASGDLSVSAGAVSAGGIVSATSMDVGANAGASGQISASGALSNIAVSGQLTVGDLGFGDVSITNGATITATEGDIGLNAGGSGVVDLEGAGSRLDITDNLNIGDAGTAVLVMGNNTTLSVANNLNIGANGVLQQFGGIIDPSNVTNRGTVGGVGGFTVSGTVTNNGVYYAQGGTYTINAGLITGIGTLAANDGGNLVLNAGSVAGTQTVVFNNTTSEAVVTIGSIAGFAASIGNFNADAAIMFSGITIGSDSESNGALALFTGPNDTGSLIGVLNVSALSGSQLAEIERINAQGGLGADTMPCFAEGTRIATTRGEIAVEALALGDSARVLIGGEAAPIIWIGRRSIDCRRHNRPELVWPVHIAAGAFAPGVPNQALWLSPDHAVFVDGVLVPVKRLVNNRTITQVPRPQITYYHLELTRHDVVLANGLPTESYLPVGDRAAFEQSGRSLALFPDFASRIWEAKGCAPLVVTGPTLAAIRSRLAERALAPEPEAA